MLSSLSVDSSPPPNSQGCVLETSCFALVSFLAAEKSHANPRELSGITQGIQRSGTKQSPFNLWLPDFFFVCVFLNSAQAGMWKANNLGVVLMEQNLREGEICFQYQNCSKYQLQGSVWQTWLHLPSSQKPLQEHTDTHRLLPALSVCPSGGCWHTGPPSRQLWCCAGSPGHEKLVESLV